jgi:hypothetical protein
MTIASSQRAANDSAIAATINTMPPVMAVRTETSPEATGRRRLVGC